MAWQHTKTVTVDDLAQRNIFPVNTEEAMEKARQIGGYTLSNHIEGYQGPYPVAVFLGTKAVASEFIVN